jgi:hypothetical protein
LPGICVLNYFKGITLALFVMPLQENHTFLSVITIPVK